MEPNILDNDFERAALRAKEDARSASDLIMMYQRNSEEVLRTLAGSHLKEMQLDRCLTQSYLSSTIDELRTAALFLMRDYWGVSPYFANISTTIAFHDQRPSVRGVALYALLKCFKMTSASVHRLLKYCFGAQGSFPVVTHIEAEDSSQAATPARTIGIADLARKRFLEKIADSHVKELIESLEFAEDCLRSPNRNLRIAALISLKEYHNMPAWFLNKCEQLALQDADESVRAVAISILGQLYEKSANSWITKLLAALVCDEAETVNLRRAAYKALLRVQGFPMPWHQLGRPRPQTSLEGIDWSLARRFLE